MSNFVSPEEVSYFVESIRPFQLADVGSPQWLDVHEIIIKLNQQAILEAAEFREEEVKELLIVRDKLKILIHEAYCVFLWKTRILTHLLEADPNPQATFMIYTVFFHEGAVMSLLDISLFHASGCEALQDSAVDLMDYCAQGIAQLIGLVSMGYHENESKVDVDDAVLTELERQKRDMIFKIGFRCISIMNYLADNAQSLPLNATRRMVVTHDIPWLMVDLLHFRPWQRRTKKGLQKFVNDKWMDIPSDEHGKLIKFEAQTWLCLRQLLFNSSLMENYEFNAERRAHFRNCHGMLHETVLDQLPPLIEFKQHLCQVTMSAGEVKKNKVNLILEEVPQIREALIKESEKVGGYFEIAQRQGSIFLCKDKDEILKFAQRLSAAYNTDMLAEMEHKLDTEEEQASVTNDANVSAPDDDKPSGSNSFGNKCSYCKSDAVKKCGYCKSVYYCSRKCQLEDWPIHKVTCDHL